MHREEHGDEQEPACRELDSAVDVVAAGGFFTTKVSHVESPRRRHRQPGKSSLP